MSATLQPGSVAELVEAVRGTPRLLAIGAGTKPRLAAMDRVKVSLSRVAGVTEYEPEEFTITALAGTPVRDIAATLAERGQYLPFDPMLADAGATLGGTVAAGLSGPGRFRFGGVRDFILGVRFINGTGTLLQGGGKVVKNAAGFDLPKFFVGSLGRFGVLAEVTLKVFPRPAATLTIEFPRADAEVALKIINGVANSRWEADAIDVLPVRKTVCVRLAGPASALVEISREILGRWRGESLDSAEAERTWSDLREFRWAHRDGVLVKLAIVPAAWPELEKEIDAMDDARAHVSAAANVAYISMPSPAQFGALNEMLARRELAGVTLRGDAPLWLGARPRPNIAKALKDALDPQQRFPGLDD